MTKLRSVNRGAEIATDGDTTTTTQNDTVTDTETGSDGRSTSKTTGTRTVTRDPPGTSVTSRVEGRSESTSRTDGAPPNTTTTTDTRSEEIESGSDGSVTRTETEIRVVTTVNVTRRAEPDGTTVTTTVTTAVTTGQRRRFVVNSNGEAAKPVVTQIGPNTVTTTREEVTQGSPPGSRQGVVQPLPPGTAVVSRAGTWVRLDLPLHSSRTDLHPSDAARLDPDRAGTAIGPSRP